MPFDQSVIVGDPSLVVMPGPALVRATWRTTAPAGTYFQVYVDGVPAGGTTATDYLAGYSGGGSPVVQVGAVAPGEEGVDFSASLPPVVAAGGGDRPRLTITPTADPGLARLLVYASPSAGAPVSYAAPVASIAVAPGSGPVVWVGAPVARTGVYQYAAKEVDAAGNVGPAATASLALFLPPAPPAPAPDGRRLHYTYDPSGRRATLAWLASPGE